jgi:UDP-4-amino-4,6-dideoxy-N-acetyl-beta-L-altrosamine N-acetyltransferase
MAEHETTGVFVRAMAHSDLALVLAWRNHPDVRRYMYTQQEIAREDHVRWFEKVLQNPRKHILIFELDHQPFGVANFEEVADGGIVDWGFYAAPDAPKGSGRKLCSAALDHGFRELNFHKVCGEVLAYNERSVRLHQFLGFQREGVLRDQRFENGRYHDVVSFGLLHHEWHSNPSSKREKPC